MKEGFPLNGYTAPSISDLYFLCELHVKLVDRDHLKWMNFLVFMGHNNLLDILQRISIECYLYTICRKLTKFPMLTITIFSFTSLFSVGWKDSNLYSSYWSTCQFQERAYGDCTSCSIVYAFSSLSALSFIIC